MVSLYWAAAGAPGTSSELALALLEALGISLMGAVWAGLVEGAANQAAGLIVARLREHCPAAYRACQAATVAAALDAADRRDAEQAIFYAKRFAS